MFRGCSGSSQLNRCVSAADAYQRITVRVRRPLPASSQNNRVPSSSSLKSNGSRDAPLIRTMERSLYLIGERSSDLPAHRASFSSHHTSTPISASAEEIQRQLGPHFQFQPSLSAERRHRSTLPTHFEPAPLPRVAKESSFVPQVRDGTGCIRNAEIQIQTDETFDRSTIPIVST